MFLGQIRQRIQELDSTGLRRYINLLSYGKEVLMELMSRAHHIGGGTMMLSCAISLLEEAHVWIFDFCLRWSIEALEEQHFKKYA